jgi:hypothetical protein
LNIIATTNMIYPEKGKYLTCEVLIKEMYIQWRLSTGKGKDDEDSENDEEVALVATNKKGGKAAGNIEGNNPNANQKCKHYLKKRHVEANCWKKHPDKIPKKVKAARKKKEEKTTSTAAAAVESNGDGIIFGAIECNETILESLDIAKGYHAIALEEENYIYFSDNKESLNNKDSNDEDNDEDDDNSNDNRDAMQQ